MTKFEHTVHEALQIFADLGPCIHDEAIHGFALGPVGGFEEILRLG